MGNIVNPISFRYGWSIFAWNSFWTTSLLTEPADSALIHLNFDITNYISQVLRRRKQKKLKKHLYILFRHIRIIWARSGLTILVPFYAPSLEKFIDDFFFLMFTSNKRSNNFNNIFLKEWRPDILDFQKKLFRNTRNIWFTRFIRANRMGNNAKKLLRFFRQRRYNKRYKKLKIFYLHRINLVSFKRPLFSLNETHRKYNNWVIVKKFKQNTFRPQLFYLNIYKQFLQSFLTMLNSMEISLKTLFDFSSIALKKAFIKYCFYAKSQLILRAIFPAYQHKMQLIFHPWKWLDINASSFARFLKDRLNTYSTLQQVLGLARYMARELLINGKIFGWKIMYKGRFRRLGRRGRATYAWTQNGELPLNTTAASISYGSVAVRLRYSTCGIKIWLCHSNLNIELPW